MARNTTKDDGGIGPDAAGEVNLEDKLVPPYPGRTGGDEGGVNDELKESVKRQMAQTHGPGNAGATSSPMHESPVRPGEATAGVPESPHGVGESTTRRGEDIRKEEGQEPGRETLGTKGESNRPYGTSDRRDSTGVDPQDRVGEDMPSSFTGHQGG